MDYNVKLPVTNKNGYYEFRLESIGGLGANLCGKLLGELGTLYLGLNSANFSSYGSEKRGSPVKAYIRFSDIDREILINSPVENPHILAIFHENMIGNIPVTAGACDFTKIIVNTDEAPDSMRDKLKLKAGEIICVDALKISIESKTRVNMVMLGAIAKVSGFIPLEAVIELVTDSMGKKYPELLKQNIEGVKKGFDAAQSKKFEDDGKYADVPYSENERKWGYKNAPIGGVNPHFGSTVSNDLSASRQGYVPKFIKEKCINCGLCDTTCPDMVFQFKKGEYKGKEMMVNMGLDYHHCKGCLRCVDVCPVGALEGVNEREYEKLYFLPNKDLIIENVDFDVVGANSYVTSEAYLDEKRFNGGNV